MAIRQQDLTRQHVTAWRFVFLLPLLLGMFALLAWVAGEAWLAAFSAYYIPMAPSTAILMVYFALLALFHHALASSIPRKKFVTGITWLVVAICLLLLISSSQMHYFAFEKLGFAGFEGEDQIPWGHMSPLTAALFLFLSLYVLISFTQTGLLRKVRKTHLQYTLLLIVFLVSFSMLLSYIMGSPFFYGSLQIPPSLPTSLGFFILSVGCLIRVVDEGDISLRQSIREGKHTVIVLISVFLFLASIIVTMGYILHTSYKSHFREDAVSMLRTTGTFKAEQLIQWRHERLADAYMMYRNPHLEMLIGNWTRSGDHQTRKEELDKLFSFYLRPEFFDAFSLCDAEGTTLYTFPAGKTSVSANLTQVLKEVLLNKDVRFQDFYRNEIDDKVYLSLVVPVMDASDTDSVRAMLVLRIDPEISLYPMLSSWPIQSESAEAVIVRRKGDDVVLLNPLRGGELPALTVTSKMHENPERPSVMSLTGRTGVVEGISYDGIPVFASLHKIPDSPWFLIVRIDKKEVFASMGTHLFNSIFIMLLLISMSALGIFLLWRQQQNRFLQEKLQVSEAADKLKTAFLNNISHEIRTPLNSILGFGQLIAVHPEAGSDLRRYFQIVQSSSNRLIGTIENYVDISMLTSGTMEVHRTHLELLGFIRQICHENKLRFSEKGDQLIADLPEGYARISIDTDSDLLKKALMHLLDNAYKFTAGGMVSVGLRLRGEVPELFVSDTGEGIPAEQLSNALDPFWRGEQDATSRYEGSGLGLPIVRGLIEKLGGRVQIESDTLSGTTVRMIFSMPAVAEATTQAAAPEAALSLAPKETPLVLVVEDDISNAHYLEVVLNSMACDVLVVSNGEEAVRHVRENAHISLVLMDLKMPVMNGYEATRHIKAIRPGLPVVAATAYALSGDENRAREAGCDDYLTKPIKLQALKQMIGKYHTR